MESRCCMTKFLGRAQRAFCSGCRCSGRWVGARSPDGRHCQCRGKEAALKGSLFGAYVGAAVFVVMVGEDEGSGGIGAHLGDLLLNGMRGADVDEVFVCAVFNARRVIGSESHRGGSRTERRSCRAMMRGRPRCCCRRGGFGDGCLSFVRNSAAGRTNRTRRDWERGRRRGGMRRRRPARLCGRGRCKEGW